MRWARGGCAPIARIVLPAAAPGVLAGVILGIGRIVGETAALIYTAGTYAQVADGLFSPARTLSVHMYVLSSEGLHVDRLRHQRGSFDCGGGNQRAFGRGRQAHNEGERLTCSNLT